MDLFLILILFRIKFIPSRHVRCQCSVTRVTLSLAEPRFCWLFGNSSSKWSEEMKTLYLGYVTNEWHFQLWMKLYKSA